MLGRPTVQFSADSSTKGLSGQLRCASSSVGTFVPVAPLTLYERLLIAHTLPVPLPERGAPFPNSPWPVTTHIQALRPPRHGCCQPSAV